jgi:hypothetical protein
VDERYVVHSIKEPSEQIVKGYPDAMPAEPLTDPQIQDVIAWLKTLR